MSKRCQKVLHEVRDLMPIVSVNPVARRRKGAKDPPRTQRVRTGGKGEAVSQGECESDRETMVCNKKTAMQINGSVQERSETTVILTSKTRTSRKSQKTEERKESCIHWGRRQRPMTGRRCSGTGARCRRV